MMIAGNTTVSTDRLTLQPFSDLLLTNLDITRSATPVTNDVNGANSIQSVYYFSHSIDMTGTIGLHFKVAELNGNPEASLALVYMWPADSFWVTAAGNLDMADNYVSYDFAGTSISGVTAVNSSTPLPILIREFSAIPELDKVKLTWHTTYEHRNDRFEIERSVDGIHFTVMATVKGANNLPGHQYISYDNHPNQGNNFYRLVQCLAALEELLNQN